MTNAPDCARRATISAALVSWFGLRPREGATLTELYLNRSGPLNRDYLAEATGQTVGSLGGAIVALRSALEAEAIDCAPGAGYFLTEVGIAECRGAIDTMSEALASAA